MNGVAFRQLTTADAEAISKLLASAPKDYLRYFHPFNFDCESIRTVLSNARKDQFFGLELCNNDSALLAGFYMLRGLDEGYGDPMYGVFIAQQFQGKGLGQSTLAHAEQFCRHSGIPRLLLKVHPQNIRAKKLYQRAGFQVVRIDPVNDNLVMEKQLA